MNRCHATRSECRTVLRGLLVRKDEATDPSDASLPVSKALGYGLLRRASRSAGLIEAKKDREAFRVAYYGEADGTIVAYIVTGGQSYLLND